MTTIEFTTIPDLDADYDLLLELLGTFRKETGIEVRTTRMQWSDAWQQLIGIATRGQGPDISYVGSTWVSSLASMNSLRPIPPHVITSMGGEEAFVHSTWEGALLQEDKLPWSIPLNMYVYAIAYRRDLLAQAGLDGSTAFATPFAVEETISKLEELHCADKAWLMPYGVFPHSMDIVHTAASWVWSSGGYLVDNRGKQVLFDSPAALTGLKAYFKLLRRQPEINSPFWAHDTLQQLIEGKAAAVLTDARGILTRLQKDTPETRNICAASVMSIPYGGGGNLVIWKHTYGHSDRLEAAFKLTEFLTRRSTMLEVGHRVHVLPARVDALDTLIPPEHPLQPVITQLIASSRTYRTIPLWRRIESQFGQELGMVAEAVLDDKDLDLDLILVKTMKRLTQRLNLMLE